MSSTRTAVRRRPSRRTGAGAGRRATTRRPRRRPVAGRRRARPGTKRRSSRNGFAAVAGRWWPTLLVAAAILAGVAWHSQPPEVVAVVGPCTVAGVTLTPEQLRNAATIAEVARSRGLPDRAVVIGLATAMQESRLRNLDYGDRDSLGLFQQRPSQGWGTPEQIQDPIYAAGRFYDHLVAVPHWESGDLTTVADTVQRSAYPLAYRKWSTMADALTRVLLSDEFGRCTQSLQ